MDVVWNDDAKLSHFFTTKLSVITLSWLHTQANGLSTINLLLLNAHSFGNIPSRYLTLHLLTLLRGLGLFDRIALDDS